MPTPLPPLTVVICTLDMLEMVRSQLRALVEQRADVPFDVVVVDNGSVDGTAASLRAEYRGQPWFQVVENPRRGLNVSRNVGVRAARSPYVALCDADDLVEPGWAKAISDACAPRVYCGGALRRAGNNDERTQRRWRASGQARVESYRHHGVPTPPGGNCAFPVEMWREVGGFDERIAGAGDETDFFYRAGLAGYEYVAVPSAVVSYRLPSSVAAVWRRGRGYGRSAEHAIRIQGVENRSLIRRRWKHWIRLALTAPVALARTEGRYATLHRVAKAVGEIEFHVRRARGAPT